VITPILGMTDTYYLTYSFGADVFRMCGSDYSVLGITSDGLLVPDGAVIFDSSPTANEMGLYAPVVASAWTDLDPSQEAFGDFLTGYRCYDDVTGDEITCGPAWLIRRSDSVSVLFDRVAVDDPQVDTASFITTLTLDGDVIIHHLDVLEELPLDLRFGASCSAGAEMTLASWSPLLDGECMEWDPGVDPEAHFATADPMSDGVDTMETLRWWLAEPGMCP